MVMMLKIDKNKIGDDLDDYSDDGLVMVITMTWRWLEEQEPVNKNITGDDLHDYSDDGHGDYEDLEEAHYSLQRQLRLPLSDPFWAGPPLFFNWAAIGVSLKEITYIRLIFEKKGG